MANETDMEYEEYESDCQENEEEHYVEFTMMEINEFIARYGANFFLSRLKDENYDAIFECLQ